MSDQPSTGPPTYEELQQRVSGLEESLARCERMGAANNYAAATMHEVNNPLEAITNLLYLARQEVSSRSMSDYLEQIEEQVRVLTAISLSSLTFYRSQERAKNIDLMQIAESALKLHRVRLQASGVRIQTRYAEDTGLVGVATEMLQVLSNLILNAMDALGQQEGGEIRIKVRRTTSALQFTICDNGPGIPEHVQPRIFEAHATSKERGMGVGLWLSKRIVNNHGGSIRYRTSRQTGRSGTVFRVTLPHHARGLQGAA